MDRISPHSVRYLSVEGGGAAGLTVHPGAVRALEELKILKYDGARQVGILAFAGSSSGSVIATLMSCGYHHDEIAGLLHPSAFDLIFRLEDLKLGKFAAVDGCHANASPPHLDSTDDEDAGALSVFIRATDPIGWGLQKPKEFEDFLNEKLNDSLSAERIMKAARQRWLKHLRPLPVWAPQLATGPNMIGNLASEGYQALRDIVIEELADRFTATALNWGRREFLEYVEKEYPLVVHKVLENMLSGRHSPKRDAFNILRLDYGLFAGCEWRDYIDNAIALAAFRVKHEDQFPQVSPPGPADFAQAKSIDDLFHDRIVAAYESVSGGWTPKERRKTSKNKVIRTFNEYRNCTFDEHQQIFYGGLSNDRPPPLNLTGANLSAQTSHVFSAADPGRSKRDTGYFRVADAVRIATGIPPAFKPFIINADDIRGGWPKDQRNNLNGRHFLEGMWMDGGLYYNSPADLFREFETDDRRTLGLGMGHDDPWVEIGNVTEFYTSMINVVYERNISATRTDLGYFINYNNFGLALQSERQSDNQIKLYQMDAYGRTLAHIRSPDFEDPTFLGPSPSAD